MALWRIRATVDDRPGFLAVLAASLALRSVNILAVQVHTTEAGAIDDFLVDAPESMSERDLIAAVEKGRGRDAWVARARAQGLVDLPTQALAVAGRVVRDPDALGEGLRQLLGEHFRDGSGPAAASVVWRPAGEERPGYGFDGGSMWLADPYGGVYQVTRPGPRFTPAEYARAQALVDVARAAGWSSIARTALLLADGTELTLRPAGPDDLPAVAAMHERCSPVTRRRWYVPEAAGSTPAQLARLLDRQRSTTLVAGLACAGGCAGGADGCSGEGGCAGEDGCAGERIVAMASLIGDGTRAEVALLVEDGWQGRGLGTALVRRIGTLAARVGYAALVARADPGNGAFLRTLGRISEPSSIECDGGVLTVTLPLNSRGVPAATPGATTGPGAG